MKTNMVVAVKEQFINCRKILLLPKAHKPIGRPPLTLTVVDSVKLVGKAFKLIRSLST